MKKLEMPRKLTLSRETLRMLNDHDLREVPGGATGVVACHSNNVTQCTICPGCTI